MPRSSPAVPSRGGWSATSMLPVRRSAPSTVSKIPVVALGFQYRPQLYRRNRDGGASTAYSGFSRVEFAAHASRRDRLREKCVGKAIIRCPCRRGHVPIADSFIDLLICCASISTIMSAASAAKRFQRCPRPSPRETIPAKRKLDLNCLPQEICRAIVGAGAPV